MSVTDALTNGGPIAAYPSLEELARAYIPVRKSPAAARLLWHLDAAWPAAVSIVNEVGYQTSTTPYFLNGVWRAIAQEPTSEPRVSSITVSIFCLSNWEFDWVEKHSNDINSVWGALLDHDPSEDFYQEGYVLFCCGEARPRKKRRLQLTVKPAFGGYVTVHDYLSTLHPWLTSLKEDIVRAVSVWEDVPAEIVIDYNGLKLLLIDEKARWIRAMAREGNPQVGAQWGRYPEILMAQQSSF
jgi:hypothetical protein